MANMLRRALWAPFKAIGRRIVGSEWVGADKAGNQYLRQASKDDYGNPRERRWVEPPAELGRNYYDPNSMPPEWHQW